MTNPYQALSAEKFWKTAVSSRQPGALFEDLWRPKFEITKKCKILTAGSCFAQHISAWLAANGYHWIEAEPAPAGLSHAERLAGGHGVFSFRTGNIYTPALLRQWISQALSLSPEIEAFFLDDGVYRDPFRPRTPAGGYHDVDALFADRRKTLAAIRSALAEADVFIFTLGLTEAWVNKKGYVYPMCPGTAGGAFFPDEHVFVNYSHDALLSDVRWIVDTCRALNPAIKFLLTVSPVPLTATASAHHVLVATHYSKAVLRAVAGAVSDQRDCVDYFPSYELIASPFSGVNFYEDNLRSVRKEGVDHVMAHFARGLAKTGASSPKQTFHCARSEDICDEILLETWNSSSKDCRSAWLGLIGDSHMGLLSKALNALDCPHVGGMIMNGTAWLDNKFACDGTDGFSPTEDAEARQRWREISPFLETSANKKVVLTNIGMQTHMSVLHMLNYMREHSLPLTQENFDKYFYARHEVKIAFLKKLIDDDIRVVVISDPPTRSLNQKIAERIQFWNIYDEYSLNFFSRMGCEVVHSGRFMADSFTEAHYSDKFERNGQRDCFHGSDKYYADFAGKLLTCVLA